MRIISKAKEVHRGEAGLGETYWLWLWLPQTVIAVLFLILALNVLWIAKVDPTRLTYNALLYGLEVLSLILLFYFGIGTFRSARRAESKFWRRVAQVIVVISFVASIRIPLSWVQDNGTSIAEFSQGIGLLNAQLPSKLDAITTLHHISYASAKLTFENVIELSEGQTMRWDRLKPGIVKEVCETWKRDLGTPALAEVSYTYSLAGRLVQKITVKSSDCVKP